VLLQLLCCFGTTVVQAPVADAGELGDVACVSNYIFSADSYDVDAWKRDLDGMRRAGFDTVWMVNVWAALQPSVLSPRFDEERIAAMREICAAARERGMKLLLVLCYVGEGWGPRGLDVPVWPLIASHRRQHVRFLRRMARETRDFENVFYLLCTEEILPATLLYSPSQRSECVDAFRAWARESNPDIAYWNDRWGTDFSWADLSPQDTTDRKKWQSWADHNAWFAHLMRELLPPMVAAIRDERPDAIIGFHDFLLSPGLGPTRDDVGMPYEPVFDFSSIGYYARPELSMEENLTGLRERVELSRSLYPGLPVFVGETGFPVDITSPEARRTGEERACEWYGRALSYLRTEGIGYSVWCWRTVVPTAEISHSLYREDDSRTPMLDVIARINRAVLPAE